MDKPNFIDAVTRKNICPPLIVISILKISNILLEKIKIEDPNTWNQIIFDIHLLDIPLTLKKRLFHGIMFDMSRLLKAKNSRIINWPLGEAYFNYLKHDLRVFSKTVIQ